MVDHSTVDVATPLCEGKKQESCGIGPGLWRVIFGEASSYLQSNHQNYEPEKLDDQGRWSTESIIELLKCTYGESLAGLEITDYRASLWSATCHCRERKKEVSSETSQ